MIPSPLHGHASLKHGESLYIIGGCNYQYKKCYRSTYFLNVATLLWQTLNPNEEILPPREGLTLNSVDGLIYILFGCNLDKCFNDIYVFNTNEPCPSQCTNQEHGVCRNNHCACIQGFFGNDCGKKLQCKEQCLHRGVCKSNGKCGCYPGYKGEQC